MKIRFCFHKPKGERGIGKAIVGLTWFYGLFYNWKVLKYNYSHEEVWIPYRKAQAGAVFVCVGFLTGECFSSTTRGDWNGVRFATADHVLGKHPERWDYIEVEVNEARLEVAMDEAKRLCGAKYDYLGILGFLNPIPVQSNHRWYCSEICDWFKKLCGVNRKRNKRISPRRAAYLLSKRFGEPKSLK